MQFSLQGAGPFLHWLTLGILSLLPIVVGYVVYRLLSLPGQIARSRGHPQAEAINVCGWMGIITFVSWPIAMVWAYLKPGAPVGAAESRSIENSASMTGALQQATQRLAAIERKLAQSAGA